jgi:MFS transporter, SP family, general alpha glucoside:H+ symporter
MLELDECMRVQSPDAVASIKRAVHLEDAQEAALNEHQITVRQALSKYKPAVFWSILVSTSIIMEGYDIVLVTSLFAQPAFSERYGEKQTDGTYVVNGPWQSSLSAAPTIGAVFGALLNGWLTHHLGYRKVLLGSLTLITAFIFPIFFASSCPVLLVGLILCGVPWGVFATMAPAYAAEVCPLALRGYLTVYVNLCWAVGQLVAAGVIRGFATRTDEWAYRIPFGIQWAWPIPLLTLLWIAPESPWWLARKDRMEEAIVSIRRLCPSATEAIAHRTLALIEYTNEIEAQMETGSRYVDCLKGINLRRTEIVCMVFAAQVWSGQPLGGTPSYFFVQAGLDPSMAFNFAVGGLGIAVIGTICSWFLLGWVGRRTIYLWGLGALAVIMLVVGIAATVSLSRTSSFIQAGFVVVWLAIYYFTVGPVCYAIISEIPSAQLRNKSICLSRIAYYISQIAGNTIFPYQVNPTEWNWHGKAGYFWSGTCALFFLWALFRLPETKARTFEELDILFAGKIPAWKFSKYEVNSFASEAEEKLKHV